MTKLIMPKTARILGAASMLAMPAILSGAYANTLTRLIPDIYAAMDVVSRELVGFLPSAGRAPGANRAAVGESVVYTIAPTMVAYDVTPAMTIPEPPDVTVGNNFMQITKARAVPFGFTGEEQRGLNNGPGYLSVQAGLIAQALRTLCNEMETDLAVEAAANGSRAYGTAGTAPFPTSGDKMIDSAQTRKILDDNGAPPNRSMVINTSAGANLRSMYNLTRANEAGTTMTLRQGELLDLHGFSIKESAKVVQFVKGTNNGAAATNAAGYAVGATVITLGSAGTGTIKAGDIITFAGDTNKYQVAVGGGDSDVSNGGTITLNQPGLMQAIVGVTVITTGNSYAANVAFSQDALHIVMRPPAIPVEGDARIDSMMVTDARSGVTFEISIWAGYRKIRAEVALAWGVKAVKPAHIAILLG